MPRVQADGRLRLLPLRWRDQRLPRGFTLLTHTADHRGTGLLQPNRRLDLRQLVEVLHQQRVGRLLFGNLPAVRTQGEGNLWHHPYGGPRLAGLLRPRVRLQLGDQPRGLVRRQRVGDHDGVPLARRSRGPAAALQVGARLRGQTDLAGFRAPRVRGLPDHHGELRRQANYGPGRPRRAHLLLSVPPGPLQSRRLVRELAAPG
mmetsp:Transcript_105090/g.313945  ORF Transcript_105090/g.313945 Transcript_105090/m.313945 type:complete len:203 (-) Transcript_105090:815-1423(-)